MASLEERFWRKVDVGLCWEWTGADVRGYGTFTYQTGPGKRRTARAHRLAWELLVGPIPEGLELDHLCKNTRCVNPDHLEPVTHLENVRRGGGGAVSAARHARITQCPQGHEYAGGNLFRQSNGGRGCRTCANEDSRRYKARRLARRIAEQACAKCGGPTGWTGKSRPPKMCLTCKPNRRAVNR